MLNSPLLKFEKSTSFLNNQLHIQENNKQLILDIIANLGLILNTTDIDKKDTYNKLLKKANGFLNTITNNVTQIEQLNLEISNIATELTKVLAEYKKAQKSKAFFIASFSNIKNNIASYVEKFQTLEIKIEKENKKFNKFINDNNFKYNFESKNSVNNGNEFSFTGFSVNDEEIINDDQEENFFEKLVDDNESIDNSLPTTDISSLTQSDNNKNLDQAITLEPIEDENFDDVIEDNIEKETETTTSILEEKVETIENIDEDDSEEEIDEKQEKINSLTQEFKDILTDLSNGKINKDDIEPMVINCFNEIASLPDTENQTNAVLSELDALDQEDNEKGLLEQEITDKDFEEIEKNNAIDMANKNKDSSNSNIIPDNSEIFESESNNIFSHFSLNDSTLTLEEVVDDDYEDEDDINDNSTKESFETIDDTEDITLDDIDVEDLIDSIDDLPLNDTISTDNTNVNDNNNEEKEEIKETKENASLASTPVSYYNNCFNSFSTIQDDIYNEYDSFKPIRTNNIVSKFKPLPKVETKIEKAKEEPKSFAKFELKPEPIKSQKDLNIDIYDDSFESLQPVQNINNKINPKYLETIIPKAITPTFNNSSIVNKAESASPISQDIDLTKNINNLIIDDDLDVESDFNFNSNIEPVITNTIDSLNYTDFNIDNLNITDIDENNNNNDSLSIEDNLDIDINDISLDDIDINDISIEDLESNITDEDITNSEFAKNETEGNFSDELLNTSYNSTSDFNQLDDDIKIDLIEEKIAKIEAATQDNETLIISERNNKVYLPYKIAELVKYIESYPNVYESLSNVVEQEFILPFNYFTKHPFKSRFTETYNLIRNREGYSAMTAIQFGLKLIPKTNLNPVVIAACKNQTELKSLIYHLDEDDLNNFKYFNIIFDVNPTKISKK